MSARPTAAGRASGRGCGSIPPTSSNISGTAASSTTCGARSPATAWPPESRAMPDFAGWTLARWLVEIAGWTGAFLILLAYLLLSLGRLTGRSALYQGMNVAGAAGFIVNGWWHGAIP